MIILFAFLIIGHILFLMLTTKRIDLFDIRFMIDVVLLFMWVIAPLLNPYLDNVIRSEIEFGLVTFIGIISLYIGLHIFSGKRKYKNNNYYKIEVINYKNFHFIIFLLVYLVLLYNHVYPQILHHGIGYFVEGRISSYALMLNQEKRGALSSAVISFIQPILLLWLGILISQRKLAKSILLYFILLGGIISIAVTRAQIIITLLIPIFILYQTSKYKKTIFTLLFAIITIYLLYILNIWRHMGFEGLRHGLDLSIYNIINALAVEFNPLRGYYILWKSLDTIPFEYGLTYFYLLVTFIPRIFWSDKPLVSHEARWTSYIFGEHFVSGGEDVGVWTFTVWGEGLTQFGVAGVIINMFLYGFVARLFSEKFSMNPHFSVIWYYYSILTAIYLRSSLSSLLWLYITLLPAYLYYQHIKKSSVIIKTC